MFLRGRFIDYLDELGDEAVYSVLRVSGNVLVEGIIKENVCFNEKQEASTV